MYRIIYQDQGCPATNIQHSPVTTNNPDHIEVYDNALSAPMCDQLIAEFETHKGRQSAGRSSGGVNTKRKDSIDVSLTSYPDWAPLVQQVQSTVARFLVDYAKKYSHILFGVVGNKFTDIKTGEASSITHKTISNSPPEIISKFLNNAFKPAPINLQRYTKGVGGYHKWHSEIAPIDPKAEALHRVLFYIFYLNNVNSGGETTFYYQDRTIEPKQGRLIIAPAGFTHTHKGNIPESNDKYILASWIKFRRFEEMLLAKQPGQS